MPTNRRRRGRGRSAVPAWVDEFRGGVAPTKGSPGWDQFIAWYFFHDEIEGLPPYDSDEGRALVAALPEETWR